MEVTTGNNISVHYTGTLTDGTVFDSSRERGQTLDFEVGSPKMIPGFNDAVLGMAEGETKNVTITPDSAYGQRDPKAIQNVPKEAFDDDFDFKVGGLIRGNGPRGPFMAKIQEIQDVDVVLDFNHPLAGHDLSFEIEVVSIDSVVEESATDDSEESAPE